MPSIVKVISIANFIRTVIELIQSCLKFPSYIKTNTTTITLCK